MKPVKVPAKGVDISENEEVKNQTGASILGKKKPRKRAPKNQPRIQVVRKKRRAGPLDVTAK